ncbi:MAG TPA: GNAT family N-acetyltransferase [Cyclobacteriaceae bacterium]
MVSIIKTDASHRDFVALVDLLDQELAERDGEMHAYYHQFNEISRIKFAIITYKDGIPVGCGALKEFEKDTQEVKRMYVLPEMRGQGIASGILKELEHWAMKQGYKKCILETGKNQPEAIELYKKSGYKIIANYGQYISIENSVCFEKLL